MFSYISNVSKVFIGLFNLPWYQIGREESQNFTGIGVNYHISNDRFPAVKELSVHLVELQLVYEHIEGQGSNSNNFLAK